jgi:hypothetical protein
MDQVITFAFSGVMLLLSAYVTYKVTKMSKRSEEAEALRREESILILKNIDAIGTLTEKVVVCVKNDRVNGDLDKAWDYRTEQKHALEDYLMKVNAMKKVTT